MIDDSGQAGTTETEVTPAMIEAASAIAAALPNDGGNHTLGDLLEVIPEMIAAALRASRSGG